MTTITVDLSPDEYLHLCRRRLEMTQGQLARRLGVARGSLTRYEIGESPVPPSLIEMVKRMAEVQQ